MMMSSGEKLTCNKLASIHTKIRAIHDRLDGAERVLEYRKCGKDVESCATYTADIEMGGVKAEKGESSSSSKLGFWGKQVMEVLRQRLNAIRQIIQRQSFYAHCFKLLTLFIVALVHLVYLHPFLEMFSVLENYSANINTKLQIDPKQAFFAHETNVLKSQMEALTNYKKNIWMSVASMCVALSTSCFFLFILPVTRIRRFHIALVGLIDLVAFATLPFLLNARARLVLNLHQHLPESLKAAHKLFSAESLMNAIQCTILPREKLPFCSQLILNSILPVVLLKYLLILCILTLAYLLVAYFIEWIIEHCFQDYFPPHCNLSDCCCCSKYSNDNCCCCGCQTNIKTYKIGSSTAVPLKSNGQKGIPFVSSVSSCGGCCSRSTNRNYYYTANKVLRHQQKYSSEPNKTYLPAYFNSPTLFCGFGSRVSSPALPFNNCPVVLPQLQTTRLIEIPEVTPQRSEFRAVQEEIPAEPTQPSD